jgi:predicted phage terminase large subunit-like protein
MMLNRAVVNHITNRTPEQILIIEAPPRHGKSEFISKYLPAWYLGVYPDRFVRLASYEASFASVWGRRARDLYAEFSPRLFGTFLSEDKQTASEWETTSGGGMSTAGAGGSFTGRGAHLLITDDLIKNAEEALSLTVRESHWEWWKAVAWTRLEPGGKAIVMATRWHREDHSGKLIEAAIEGTGVAVRRLSFPAIAEEGDILGRKVGEPLFPERFDLDALAKIKLGMDAYWWSCLYQQRPGEHGRTEWPAEYWQDIYAPQWPHKFEVGVIALDPSKGRDTKRGDYSALVFAGMSGGKIWVDADIQRRDVQRICEDCASFTIANGCDSFGVEANAFQDLLAEPIQKVCELRNIPPLPISLINNQINKEVRISRLGPYFQQRKIQLRPTPGSKLLLSQLREWPHGDHDDGPDAMEMAIRLLQWVARGKASKPVEEELY